MQSTNRREVTRLNYKETLRGVNRDAMNETIRSICMSLVKKGFSFRQAEAILELAKERLKDAEI